MPDKAGAIAEVFLALRRDEVDYMLLRNPENIPANCSITRDIDLLVHKSSASGANRIFERVGFRGESDTDVYYYGAGPHRHYYQDNLDLHFDITTGLYYRSLNDQRVWIPVHQRLQVGIFERRKCDPKTLWHYMPSALDQLVHLVCHCIFDKRHVKREYAVKIQSLYDEVRESAELGPSLELIFFKWTPELMSLIDSGRTELLYEKYVTFIGY